jgi:hypothetical protein
MQARDWKSAMCSELFTKRNFMCLEASLNNYVAMLFLASEGRQHVQ